MSMILSLVILVVLSLVLVALSSMARNSKISKVEEKLPETPVVEEATVVEEEAPVAVTPNRAARRAAKKMARRIASMMKVRARFERRIAKLQARAERIARKSVRIDIKPMKMNLQLFAEKTNPVVIKEDDKAKSNRNAAAARIAQMQRYDDQRAAIEKKQQENLQENAIDRLLKAESIIEGRDPQTETWAMNLVSKVLSKKSTDEFAAMFMEQKGIGPKSAMKIADKIVATNGIQTIVEAAYAMDVEAITDIIGKANVPGTSTTLAGLVTMYLFNIVNEAYEKLDNIARVRRGELGISKYYVREFKLEQFLSEEEKEALKAVNNAKTNNAYGAALEDLVALERKLKGKALRVQKLDLVPWTTQRESQLSRALGIGADEHTDDINLINLACAVVGTPELNEDEDKLTSEEYAYFDKVKHEIAETLVYRAVAYGMHSIDDKVAIKPMLASPGQQKKLHAYAFTSATIKSAIRLLTVGGIDVDKINAEGGAFLSKWEQWKALVTSTSKSMKEAMGWTISARETLIVKDITRTIHSETGFLVASRNNKGEVQYEIVNDLEVKVTDGMSIIYDKRFNGFAAQCRCFVAGKSMVVYFDLIGWCKKNNYSFMVESALDGKEYDIRNFKMIMHESVVKVADFFHSQEEYWNFAEANADLGFNEVHLMAMAKTGAKRKSLTRQSLQNLLGLKKEDIHTLALPKYESIIDLDTIEGAKEMLTRGDDIISKIYATAPEMVASGMAHDAIAEIRERMIRDLMHGGVGSGIFQFIACDPSYIADILLGKMNPDDENAGLLGKREIVCKNLESADLVGKHGGLCYVLRYPTSGIKVFAMNLITSKKVKHWLNGYVAYFSAHDAIVSLIDGDFDGDEALFGADEIIINEAERLESLYRPVSYKMPKANKSKIETIADSYCIVNNLTAKKAMQVAQTWVHASFEGRIGPKANDQTKGLHRTGKTEAELVLATASDGQRYQEVNDCVKGGYSLKPRAYAETKDYPATMPITQATEDRDIAFDDFEAAKERYMAPTSNPCDVLYMDVRDTLCDTEGRMPYAPAFISGIKANMNTNYEMFRLPMGSEMRKIARGYNVARVKMDETLMDLLNKFCEASCHSDIMGIELFKAWVEDLFNNTKFMNALKNNAAPAHNACVEMKALRDKAFAEFSKMSNIEEAAENTAIQAMYKRWRAYRDTSSLSVTRLFQLLCRMDSHWHGEFIKRMTEAGYDQMEVNVAAADADNDRAIEIRKIMINCIRPANDGGHLTAEQALLVVTDILARDFFTYEKLWGEKAQYGRGSFGGQHLFQRKAMICFGKELLDNYIQNQLMAAKANAEADAETKADAESFGV